MSRSKPNRQDDLTELQRLFLQLVADGFGQREAGMQMNITAKTAEEYSWECRRKLGAKTIAHAVAIGLRTGAIR